MLASQLAPKYRHEPCAILALGDGGVIIGAQIATELHCVLTLLLSEEITLPRELEAIAGISQDGSLSFNSGAYSSFDRDELTSEYYQYIEQEKLQKIHDLQHMLGRGNTVDRRLLTGKNVILASDGLSSGFAIDIAMAYLKIIPLKRIIAATPLASVQAVDRMHVATDEIHCLSVVENFITTDHYYDQQDIPPHEKVIEIVEQITSNWK